MSQAAGTEIKYPYLAAGGTIEYVNASNPFMQAARAYAQKHSLDHSMPNASVIVKDGIIVGHGANGSTYHDEHGCERIKQNVPTGQGYELCEGCHPKNHSEPKAVADALKQTNSLDGAALYLWGHWWCCEPCWDRILETGINTVKLLQDSQILFNKEAAGNIVGRQFEST